MAIHFNVTDAVGPASNHGITRTERRLAAALAGHPDVGFVMVRDRRAWRVDPTDVLARLEPDDMPAAPGVERYGVDPVPPRGRRHAVARRVRRALAERGRRGVGGTIRLEPFHAEPSDVLVSVGLDWVHGLLDVASRHVYGTGGSFVGFCYDLIPIDHPEWLFPPDPVGFRRHLERMTTVASSVLCISECTRTDLLRHFPEYGAERAQVLRLGADAAVVPRPEHERFAASLFDGAPYAIYCATLDRRKNHHVLYRALRELSRHGVDANLVFVGMLGSGVDDLVDSLRHDPEVAGRVVHVTDCDDHHLAALYRRARFAVYPSLYEGWGLGVTEALAHGIPCLIASGSSLGEAGLGVCRELHPLKTAEWVDAIAAYFDDTPALPPIELPTWSDAARSMIRLVTP